MNVYSDVTARLESLLKGPTPDIPDYISYVMFEPRQERDEKEIIFGGIIDRQLCFKFTTLGATGRLGPTALGNHYRGQNHEHLVTLHDGIQHFTVPRTGTYRIEIGGAAAGWGVEDFKSARGRGAILRGTFNLKQGETLKILVGQEGAENEDYGYMDYASAGGGGGTFVTRGDNTPLIIAGGGGGAGGLLHDHDPQCDGTVDTTGNMGYDVTCYCGGSNGQGATEGEDEDMGGGGGGLLTDGGSSQLFEVDEYACENGGQGGTAFVNGGFGGCGMYNDAEGGFGGGGGSHGGGGGGGGEGGTQGAAGEGVVTQIDPFPNTAAILNPGRAHVIRAREKSTPGKTKPAVRRSQ
ncbi:Hypp169 [Branchiostoma lanceolatum]|uniref:Hypp169 protein n=1 Tax=Branchiostoma lanceolatum TaxID=7740 RepID=A0A8J9W1Y1_BRALA|nr:Hypp169 [Branchiostoma lanceolatum]